LLALILLYLLEYPVQALGFTIEIFTLRLLIILIIDAHVSDLAAKVLK
jgi:hypothetical protein